MRLLVASREKQREAASTTDENAAMTHAIVFHFHFLRGYQMPEDTASSRSYERTVRHDAGELGCALRFE